jgi:addiction module HigA family antidote
MRLPRHRRPTHPGEMLVEEFLKPLQLSQADTARRLNMPLNRLNELVKGKRGMTPDTALRLAELFNVSAEVWMNLQVAWDLWHAVQRRKARGEVGSILPIGRRRSLIRAEVRRPATPAGAAVRGGTSGRHPEE